MARSKRRFMQPQSTTHTRPHTHEYSSTPSPHRSRMLTSLPGLKSKSKAPTPAHGKLCRANETGEWAYKMANRPETHSQSTRTHYNTTHAASMGRTEAPSKRRRTLA